MNIEGTAYEIIANALGLVQDGKAWVDKDGERFVLTKYGFQYAVLMPPSGQEERIKQRYTKTIKALSDSIGKKNKQIDRLYDALGKHLGYSSKGEISKALDRMKD